MKNTSKKSLVALMAVSALIPVMSAEVSASEKVPNAESDFEFSNGVITKYVGTSKDVVIPSSIGEVEVKEIGFAAFRDNYLISVEIPNTVVVIGVSAFQNNNLTSVEIPNTVTSIKSSAFRNNNLTTVVIPNSVSSIENYTFDLNNLTTVEIPNSVTTIGSHSFSNNDLISVEIPNSVTSIGEYAFQKNNLTSVEIPNSVTSIGNSVFYGNNLTSVEIPNSVTSIGDNAFYQNNLTSVEIPNSVTSIGNSAFLANNITTVEIPNSVTSIEDNAFYFNPLTKVTIPENVTSIGTNAFKPSTPLTTADVPIQGKKGSQAETYATTNGHPFNALPEPNEHSQEATLNLFGGTLSLDAPLFESFGTVELQSDVQVVTSNFMDSFKVFDARGTGEGWRLDVTSTQMEMVEPEDGFKEGTSTLALPVGTLALDPLESIKPYNDSNGILPTPILDTTSIIDDGAITIAKADVGEGMGAFELTFGEGAFSVTIDPSTAKIDKINYPDSDTPYEATVTWTLVSAP